MLILPYHVIVLALGALAAMWSILEGPSLVSLDLSPLWGLPLLWLGRVTGDLVDRNPGKLLLSTLHLAAPLLVFGAFLFGTNWATWALSPSDFRAVHEGYIGLSSALIFAPLLLAHLSVCTPATGARWKLVGNLLHPSWRVRIPLAIWAMLLVQLALGDALSASDALRANCLVYPTWQFVELVFSLALVLFFASRMFVAALDLVPLEGHLRRRAEALAEATGIKGIKLQEWRTDHEISNAMVVVQPPTGWRIVFTDRLLETMGPEEFEAVVAHELGHIRGGHVRAFIIWLAGASAAFLAIDALGLLGSNGVTVIASAALFATLLASIGFLSRRFELEADFFAADSGPDNLARALQGLTANTGRYFKSGFRHFSTSRRVLFLRALQCDEHVGDRLQTNVRSLRKLGVSLLIVSLGALVLSDRLTVERSAVVVAAQLGQLPLADELYASAGPWTRSQVLFDKAKLGPLLTLGASLAGDNDSLTGSDLAAEALRALEREPNKAGLDSILPLLDLAILISFGNAPAERHFQACLTIQSTAFGGAHLVDESAALPELPRPWQQVAKAAAEILRED